jgi:lipid A 4'-phosphatase
MFGLSKWFLAAFVVCSLFFVLFPRVDIHVSSVFFSPEHGRFVLEDDPLVVFVYQAVQWGSRFLVVFLVLGLGVTALAKKKLIGLGPKAFVYLLLVFVLGPLLLINVVLKNNWCRARPHEIEAFAGTKRFTAAFVISDASDTNGSWPSGHAAFGFYFVAVAMLLRKRRALTMVLACALGTLIGLARMVQGRHFLSDVVCAFFFVFLVARVLYYVLYESKLGAAWQWRVTS